MLTRGNTLDSTDSTMNIAEQGKFICRKCGQKEGLLPLATAVWHYATCIKCRAKDAVTEQEKTKPMPA